jgi:hypothetical protein
MKAIIISLLAALPVLAQEIKLPASLDRLAAKASETVDVSLDGALLQLAGKFLSSEKADEAKVKNLITGLKGIYVKNFEFDKEGEYTEADVEAIRSQLRAPGWSRIVGVVSKRDGEKAEIYAKPGGDRVGGLVILAAEPKELTIVNIVGTIDLDQLSELGGRFGIPRVEVERKKPAKD